MNNGLSKTFQTILFALITWVSMAQIPTGTWRDHLPYTNAIAIEHAEDKIYCATELALFYYDLNDNTVNKLTKINKLSDLEIGAIGYSKTHKKLVVGYKNGNIDIISDHGKTNIVDIKAKNIIANKAINDIYIFNDMAFLSTGFGIIELNLNKNEISDSYIIGNQGSYMNINNTIVYNDTIFALTNTGIYKADINNEFLANYENWIIENGPVYPNNQYYAPVVFNNELLLVNSFPNSDSCYVNKTNGTNWTIPIKSQELIYKLYATDNYLFTGSQFRAFVYNTDYAAIDAYNGLSPKDLFFQNKTLWLADKDEGLIKANQDKEYIAISPNGPKTTNAFEMYYNAGQILVAHGGYTNFGVSQGYYADVYSFNNETWTSFDYNENAELLYMRDAVSFASNQTIDHYFVGTWGYGIAEIKNNKLINIYNSENTDGILGDFVSGMSFDEYGNLWATCHYSDNPFVVKTPSGNWYNYSFDGSWNKVQTYKMIHTQSGTNWAICYKSGEDIYVWDAKDTPGNSSDDEYNTFLLQDKTGTRIGSGKLNDIVEDIEGSIWIATSTGGVAVYDDPGNVTDKSRSHYARVPQLVVDGYLKNLLEDETVNCIAVDGANRKWFGTSSGGVFLVSADGTEQIINWNTSNSKLFSNNILEIEINHKTGEVFIATDKGMQSYMGTSTENKEDYSDIYAFPNPVKEDYNGFITIRGLMYQTHVKITDLSGRLVFSTESNGGDAIWNGKDLAGKPVTSGIYLVLCTNPDGSEAEATKIMVIK